MTVFAWVLSTTINEFTHRFKVMKKIILITLCLMSSLAIARNGQPDPDPVPEIDGALAPQVMALAVGIALLIKRKK